MAERLSRLPDADLALALVDLGRSVRFPPEPNVAPAVFRRIREVPVPVRRRSLLERLLPARPLRRAAEGRPSGDAAPSPEVAVLEREQREQLMEAVNGMREEDRLVIGYRYFLGLSERETAATLHVPAGTVKSRLARALSRLRTAVEEREDEPAPEEGNRG